MKYRIQIAFILLFLIGNAFYTKAQQIIRNYSFEYFDCTHRPISWSPQFTKTGAYNILLHNDEVYDGKYSVSILSNPMVKDEGSIGLFNTMITKDLLEGKDTIKVSAYVKTRNVTDGVASIWMQLNGMGKIVRDINYDKTGLTGNTDWTKIEIALPITPDVISAAFGCKFTGNGEAFYDAFSVIIDGKEIQSDF